MLGIEGAAGYCLDSGIFIFATWVENECQEAESRATNEMFARSNRARAFARCMGDDMETSTAGFADPFKTGDLEDDPLIPRQQKRDTSGQKRRYKGEQDGVIEEEITDDISVSYGV